MAAIKNERDILLQATSPRLLSVATNYISIIPTTNTLVTTGSGVVPTNIDIRAFLNGVLAGAITWNIIPATPYTTIADGIRIAGADIAIGTSVTVEASINFLGVLYEASTILTHAANSSVISLFQSSANINKTVAGVFSPSTVTFSAKISDGTGSPLSYSGRFVVDISTDGVSYSNLYTSASNESSYVYTPSASHKVVRVKLYKAGGIITLIDEASATISSDGVSGSDGEVYSITPSVFVLSKNQNNGFSPTSVTFIAKLKTGIADPANYSGRFKIYENDSLVASYTSVSDENSTVYIPTTSCTKIKCELYKAGGTTIKVDEQTVNTTTAGSHGITAILSNEAHVFPASSTGAVSSYSNSGTEIAVYEGSTQIPYDEAGYTAGNSNTWKVTTVSLNITPGAKSDIGTNAFFGDASGVASGTDVSTITYTISGRNSIGSTFIITKTQHFSKSKQGPEGPTDISNLLTKNGSNILTGTIVPNDTGAFKVGSITWNSSTGALTGGTGIAITEWGIIGAAAGVPNFTIEAASGAATFRGNISGGANIDITGQGLFNGILTSSGVNAAIHANTTLGAQVGVRGDSSNVVGAGVLGRGTGGASGVQGYAISGSGAGIYAVHGAGGVALRVVGTMTISSSTLVSNLNADMVDGKHAASLCSIVVPDTGTCTVSGGGFNLISTITNTRVRGNNSNGLIIESTSDVRLKQDILNETLGLAFIKQLSPVTFRLIDNPIIKYHGFIGQDIEVILGSSNNDSLCRLVPETEMLSVDYLSLVGPMVKAIQELEARVVALENL